MQPARCHHCNYDLTGLQGRGVCPECGKSYHTGSLYRETQSEQNPLSRYAKPIALGALAIIILLCGGALAVSADHRLSAVLITLALAALPAFGAFVYWWSDRAEQRDSE